MAPGSRLPAVGPRTYMDSLSHSALMNETRYQFSTTELLLLPFVAIAAPHVNAALNYLLYDVERASNNIWYDSIASTHLISKLPAAVSFSLESMANRGVDTAVAFLIAIALVTIGRLAQFAALLLLFTLPFSPQIGRSSPDINVHSLMERWPEFLTTFAGVFVVLYIAARVKCCRGSRTQLLALCVFFFVAALGWWNMNPSGFSGTTLQTELKADNKSAQQSRF